MWLQGTWSWLQGHSKLVSIGTIYLDTTPLLRGSQDLTMPCNVDIRNLNVIIITSLVWGGLKALQCHQCHYKEVTIYLENPSHSNRIILFKYSVIVFPQVEM